VELQQRLEDLRKEGLGLAAISYDPPDILAAFSRQRGITFPLLADLGSATIKRYGILNTLADDALGPNATDPVIAADVQKYVSGVGVSARMRGMAFPGTFVLDRSGRVKARFFEESYIERNTVSSVMMRVGGSGAAVPGTAISTEHLDIRSYPTEAAIAPGNRFAIAFEISPKPGIHVYAPGASGYRVIGVSIAAQPFVRVLPLKYPPAQIYFFRPLNERIPVYQKPFTLLQEIVAEGHPQAQAAFRGKETLAITGSLEYQACNDTTCFNPGSVPLSWAVSLRPILTGRPVAPNPQ
jgi:peroxiredoxin